MLAGGLGAAVAFALLGIVSLFVPLDWGSAQSWVLALLLGGAAFAALGIALAVLARDVETATLLAFALALPLAFLALVPENAVSAGLYDVIRVISACFPFKPALDGLQRGLDGDKARRSRAAPARPHRRVRRRGAAGSAPPADLIRAVPSDRWPFP